MTDTNPGLAVTQCDCGYRCQGETVPERVSDAQRHARDVHGIDVSVAQVLASPSPATDQGDTT